MFLFLEMCYLEWDIPKRKIVHLEWDEWSTVFSIYLTRKTNLLNSCVITLSLSVS